MTGAAHAGASTRARANGTRRPPTCSAWTVNPRPALLLVALALGACHGPPRSGSSSDRADDRAEPPAPLGPDDAAPVGSRDALPRGPLTLLQAVRLALRDNPAVGIALQRVEQARAASSEAGAAFLPGLDARFSWTRTDDPLAAFGFLLRQRAYAPTIDPNQPGIRQDLRPELLVQWNLFRGGADLARYDAAGAGEEAAREALRATRNALASAAAEAFLALAKAQDLVPVAEQSLAAVETALADARAREAAGKALLGDVRSLEARRAEASEALLRARNGVELGRAGLRAVLALPFDAPLELAPDSQLPLLALPADPIGVLARAHEQRPELRAARALSTSREHEAAAADREANPFLPRVDAFGAYGVDARNLRFSSQADNWTLGVQVDLNLFFGGRDRARARRADARLAEAREEERRAALEVELDVRRSLLALDEARQRVDTAGEGLTAAEEALRVVAAQFSAGTVTVTRYLEAEVALRDARARLVVARFDERIARIGLARALGELGQAEGDEP